ncbi:MAG: porin [Candidatus Acidiferrales bacterium]
MKLSLKCVQRVATVILAVSFAAVWVPAYGAEDQPPESAAAPAASAAPAQPSSASPAAQPASSSSAPSETQQRLADLEKEVGALQAEIASLKESETPAMKTAAYVQPVNAPPADDAPQKVTLAGLLGPVTLSGFVDTYYAFNFNQPSTLGTGGTSGFGGNTGQFFDNNTNQFSLNAIELVADKAPDATAGGTGRAGYHVGLIYGEAAAAINGSNPTDANNLALKEAYIDYIAPIGKGLTFTVGKFVTPAGNEVIESNGNWNYSRSILFYYAIPYFHFGINAKYTFNPQWSITGYLVNGWNNSQESNTGKTYGVSLAWTPNKYWAVTENYLAGPQDDIALGTGYVGKPNDNWRQLEDATIAYTPNAKWALAVNGDYGYGDKTGNFSTVAGNSKAVDWWGAAGYAKYNFNAKAYFAARYEYFSDPQGFELLVPFFNTHVEEGTATFAYNLTDQFQTRFEFRENFANRDIFQKGTNPSHFVETEPIAEVGFIYTFSSANAK